MKTFPDMLTAFPRRVLGCVLFVACAGTDPRAGGEPGGAPPRFDMNGTSGALDSTGEGQDGAVDPGSPASPSQAANEGNPVIETPVIGNGAAPDLASGDGAGTMGGGAGGGGADGVEAGAGGASGASSVPPMPGVQGSPGCGQPSPAQGQLSIRVGGVDAPYTVTLPPGYDASAPQALVFGFHGRGRTHLEFQQVDASGIQTEVGSRAVMAYLKSQAGNGWNFAEEVEPNVAFFEAVYAQMLQNYCIDQERVFAIGHSSGGYFSNILGCRFADRIRGIASIAGASQETNCQGRVAALVIHGVRDSVVSFDSGRASRDGYLARNACGTGVQPAPVQPCVAYSGCADGFPVQWCEHQEPTYENTNHGWPSFASRAVGEFLFSLP